MTVCLGCSQPARKTCHICCKPMYCSSACAYRCADNHLRNCFVPFNSTLFREVLGSNPISEWMSKVVEDVSKKHKSQGGIAKEATKSRMVLRSGAKK